jgi:hypothetical protein
MNILKFKELYLTFEDLGDDVIVVNNSIEGYEWSDTERARRFCAITPTPQLFLDYFNNRLRNRWAYCINWTHIMPMDQPVGNPFGQTPEEQMDFIYTSRSAEEPVDYFRFDDLEQWMDVSATLKNLFNVRDKCLRDNEFTPDDDITIDELKKFRKWLADEILKYEPFIHDWKDPEGLTRMLVYYSMNMKDATVDALIALTPYMENRMIVASIQKTLQGVASLGIDSGCGCNGGGSSIINAPNSSCDPLALYKTAIYNYMVETFSNLEFWTAQLDICGEMKKYIEGILKVGLPLTSRVIDPFSDCSCNSVDNTQESRYRHILEDLVKALDMLLSDNVTGNKNFITTSFNAWATYLYESMYWA